MVSKLVLSAFNTYSIDIISQKSVFHIWFVISLLNTLIGMKLKAVSD